MLAYFDFSGHPRDKDVIAIAAWAGTEKHWKALEEKWLRRLRREKITHFHMNKLIFSRRSRLRREKITHFHMNKFESRHRPFIGWDNDRRLAFIADMIAFINNADLIGETHAIVMEDWRAMMENKFKDAFERKRAAYVLLMQTAIWKITHRIKLKKNETLACIFEKDHFVEKAIGQHFITLKKEPFLSASLGTLTFGEKLIAPLQAADLLAYEGMKQALNQVVNKGNRPTRKSFKQLRVTGRLGAHFMDEVSFMKALNYLASDGAIADLKF